MNNVELDESTHTYKLDGKKVPSVTGIINTVFGDKPWFTDYFAKRGTALHKAIEYYNDGDLDLKSVDDAIKGRLNGYKKFLKETSLIPRFKEQYLISKKYRFGGKYDIIYGAFFDKEHLILADYKSSFDQIVYLQLAAYRLLIYENHPEIKLSKCLVIVLNQTGTYKLKWIQKKDFFKHEQLFLSCLNIYNFIQQNK